LLHALRIRTSHNFMRELFADREYVRTLLNFALPITLQNLIMSSLNMVSMVMIGQLGETPVAAVGLANQIFFLLQLILFGINTGSAIFTAQFWGKGDIPNIRRVHSFAILLGLAAALIFLLMAVLAPEFLLGIYSKDPEVIAAGSEFLRIFGWAYLFTAVSFSYAIMLRSTGQVKIPMLTSTVALVFNTILSYLLIFGKLGFPNLGISGAATAGLLARILECGALLGIVYMRRMPIALRLSDIFGLDWAFVTRIFKPVLPVILNETFWSLGITAYYVVYARIGTESVAAMNISATIENLAMVMIFGISHATAILIGNHIGAGEEQRAFLYAVRSLALVIGLGLLIGGVVLLASPAILSLYKVDPQVIFYAKRALTILALLIWVRGSNALMVVGILRSGGDTRFSLFLDGLVIWIVGVPAAVFTAFVLKWPVHMVYLAIMSEEILKCGIGMWRVFSKKWIHNMTQTVET
jgi:putative MATE family efflux protein